MVAEMFLNPAPSQPAPGMAAGAAPAESPAPAPAAPAPEKAKPEYRLSGIIYTVAHPAAIMNGQTVYLGDWVDGATVVGIYRTHVVLQINGQRKTFVLR